MERWQEEMINELLDNRDVVQVPSNGRHTRFYTEPLESEQWNLHHHLIDLEHAGSGYATLTITELSTNGSAQVRLTSNEVDALLTVLLKWRCAERAAYERATHEPWEATTALDESDGDEFP